MHPADSLGKEAEGDWETGRAGRWAGPGGDGERGGERGNWETGRLGDWEIGTGNLSVHDMDSRVPSPFSSPPSNGDSKATVIYARGVIPLVN